MSDFLEMARSRYSCRDYDPQRPVEHDKLVYCIEAAQLAPSACNSQPWHFTVVEGHEEVERAAHYLQIAGINQFADRTGALIVINEEPAGLKPAIAEKLGSQYYAQMDIGIAAAHLCYAAQSQGLSTCIMGWFDEDGLKSLLHIPADKPVRLVIAVGYAREEREHHKKRKPFKEICDFIR